MAIFDQVPGLEVTVTQNGEAIREHVYDEVVEQPRTTTRYIEAKSGRNFEICLKLAQGTNFQGDSLECRIFVDGTWVRTPLLLKRDTRFGSITEFTDGVKTGQDLLLRKFRFAGLQTATEAGSVKGDAAKVKDLGSIVVKVTKGWAKKITGGSGRDIDMNGPGALSEKAIKGQAISHSTGLDDAIKYTGPKPTYWDWRPLSLASVPCAIFVFHYRSNEALKSMLIIPRTPSPSPTPTLEEKDWNDMTAEEQATVMREYRALKKANVENAVKVKREREDNNPRPRKIARPKAGDTQLKLDEDGGFREGSTDTLEERVVIEID